MISMISMIYTLISMIQFVFYWFHFVGAYLQSFSGHFSYLLDIFGDSGVLVFATQDLTLQSECLQLLKGGQVV